MNTPLLIIAITILIAVIYKVVRSFKAATVYNIPDTPHVVINPGDGKAPYVIPCTEIHHSNALNVAMMLRQMGITNIDTKSTIDEEMDKVGEIIKRIER